MSKFKVGDRVRVKQHPYMLADEKQEVGTIILANSPGNRGNRGSYTVRLDGYMALGFMERELQLLQAANRQKIVIIADDRTTLARLYEKQRDGYEKLIKSAEAKCAPSDTFDFAIGARLAFERLMDVDKPAKPAEPVQEPIKLYCVRDDAPGEWLTKGKVYEVSDGKITFDDGWQGGFEGFEDFIARNQVWKNCLVPLVKRPAKVGEWVLIVNAICTQGDYENGDVLHYKDYYAKWLYHDEYLVLDGYQPEPKEPQYYNGKAMCVGATPGFTTGKVYEFTDGRTVDDDGDKRPCGAAGPVMDLQEGWAQWVNLIEFKG